jgi:hypothetical protein
MNIRSYARFLRLSGLCFALVITAGHVRVYGSSHSKGLKSSDPQLSGARDMNYDRLIIAGDRVGPVRMGGLVSDAVQHLGNPDSVIHDYFHDNSGVASYWYKEECIGFFWEDSGIDPRIKKEGSPGITVHCDKWSTPDGLHVGSSMKDVSAHIRQYCPTNRDNRFIIYTKEGIAYEAKDRNSPVTLIHVIPVMNSQYNGLCTE